MGHRSEATCGGVRGVTDISGCTKLTEFATSGGEYLSERTAGSMTRDGRRNATPKFATPERMCMRTGHTAGVSR